MNGGAVDWYRGAMNGYILNSTFENNTANRSGGAVHWSGQYGIIRDSSFINNKAIGGVISDIGGVMGGGDGGAIIWVGSHGLVDNCTFNNNYAQYRGGAIFLHGNSTENCTNTSVIDSEFSNNIAGLNGGALDWQNGTRDGRVIDSTFTNNTAWRSGGAIYWYGTNGTVSGSDFIDNLIMLLVMLLHMIRVLLIILLKVVMVVLLYGQVQMVMYLSLLSLEIEPLHVVVLYTCKAAVKVIVIILNLKIVHSPVILQI